MRFFFFEKREGHQLKFTVVLVVFFFSLANQSVWRGVALCFDDERIGGGAEHVRLWHTPQKCLCMLVRAIL